MPTGAPAHARPVVAREARQTQIAEIQRARVLAAATRVVDELGYADTTVAHITGRARVSRRTFYELYVNRDDCLVAVLEDAFARLAADVAAAGLERLAWRERMRRGLWAILCFLEREPVLARVCVVQSLRGGPVLLARREQLLAGLARAVDEGRKESTRGAGLPELTAEGLVSAAIGILHSRLLRSRRGSLCELQRQLMAMLVLPYLGAAAARREQERPSPGPAAAAVPRPVALLCDPLEGVEMRVTYRTTRVLEGVAELPGSSNRQIADHAGIHDQGQVSKLLGRLERLGLVANSDGHLKGEPNAWTLTARGEQVAQGIRLHTIQDMPREGRARQ